MKNRIAALCFGFSLTFLCRAQVELPPNAPAPVQFAASDLIAAARQSGVRSHVRIEIDGQGVAESFRIEREGNLVRVIGADPTGAMYGGLEVAEAIRVGALGELKPGERKPYLEIRGIKFNIPLDVRTPSYSDNSSAAQANIPEMWSLEFWESFLDQMARDRFNVLTLWSLHPFPSIVKVPEYPEVALNDVLRAQFNKFDDAYSHSGKDMFRPELLEDAEVVRKMTIDEKIQFWRDVMQLAKDRGVKVYWFTWNAFLHGAEGKHGLDRNKPDENMIRYFRCSVRETVKTYPLLSGMGVTAGELMGNGLAGRTKEQWLWQTYGEGVRDALKETPERSFHLVHRFHQTDIEEIEREWKDYPGPFDFSYKYAVAHMYGMTNPPFINPLLPELNPSRRTWLTVRNDDIYSFRWGDPQFARDFIRCMPGSDKVAGFYMGPDGYCWGREAMDLEPESPRQLVMQKQWFSFMLWGRLSYDPTIPDAHFERVLAAHFPNVPADTLLTSWSAASRVIPETTRFIWGNIDVKWLPEACISHPKYKGFYDVRDFMEGEGMPESGDLTIREWRQRLLNNEAMDGLTPLQVAANLRRHAEQAMQGVSALRPLQAKNKELRLTLGDIDAFARLGQYYAEKIEGASELALFDATSDTDHQQRAIQHLEQALEHWQAYAGAYTKQYRQPLLYNRVGWVDIPRLAEQAAADIEMARTWKPGSLVAPPPRKAGGSKFGQ